MSCPSAPTLSMHADLALAPQEAAAVERHLEGCAACRAAVAALGAEAAALKTLLQAEDAALPIPPLERPLGARGLLAAAAGVAAAALLVERGWRAAAEAVPAALRWLDPLDPQRLLDLSMLLLVHLTREGNAMIASITELAAGLTLAGLLALACYALAKRTAGTAALLSLALLAGSLPERGDAVEIRRGDGMMHVPAGETIDDTLMIFGEIISIDGDVTGDVVAFGRRVTIRGNVGGDIITGAETVNVEGGVGGNVIGFGRDVTLAGASVAGNFYGFGGEVAMRTAATVDRNAALFGGTVAMHGRVGVDLLSFAQDLEVGGNVVRDVQAFGQNVAVLPQASIGGDLISHVPEEESFRRSGGASVGGSVDTRVEGQQERSRYLTASFYVWQALWLGAAFLTGLLLLWLAPSLRNLRLWSGEQMLRAGGLGLVAAVVMPVVSIVLLITIVGIPLGIAGLVAWLLGLYFGKIVVAQQIGRRLFQAPHGLPHHAATLIAGLVVVMIAINLPFLGGLANLVLTLVGLGLIASRVMGRVRPPVAA